MFDCGFSLILRQPCGAARLVRILRRVDDRQLSLGVRVFAMSETLFERTVLTGTAAESTVSVRYRESSGRFVDTVLIRLPVADVLSGLPVREFRAWRGRRHYSGWYWSATTRAHVVYESRLELARILVADHDPAVVGIAAQPFLLEGDDGGAVRRHVPDLLLARADGSLVVVDVKAAARLDDPKVVAQFGWTRRVCDRHGFEFEVWSGADAVVLANLRFLAGYRREGTVAAEAVEAVLGAVTAPVRIGDLERSLSKLLPPWSIRPAVLHLLWRSVLRADLSRPLDGDAVVAAGVMA
ncbi:TnsA-like heteromeric transposase endonuclease subunit [Nocardia africana]|uniref:TnsA-like heteromeric transposase endonuclease subunit n=1 Tax=Nocardia africana TaxID=134964 RepID=A0ABW6NTI3_9NOCA